MDLWYLANNVCHRQLLKTDLQMSAAPADPHCVPAQGDWMGRGSSLEAELTETGPLRLPKGAQVAGAVRPWS